MIHPQSKLRGTPLVWCITLCSTSCYLLFGYDQGVLGGLVSQPSFLKALGNPTPGYVGTIVAMYNVGCLIGCLTAAIFGYKLGRRRAIWIGCAIMILGAIIQATIHGAAQLIVGRIISGIGNGMNTSTIPVWVSETAQSNRRGSMVAIQLNIVIFGIVFAYWLDYGTVKNLTGEIVWRFPIAFQIVFAVITLATIMFLPESPRWLYAQGHKEESVEVLSRLMSCDEDDERIKHITNEMEEAIRLEAEQPPFHWKNLIIDKTDVKTTRRLILCFMIQMMQQFTGINVTAFYITIVLQQNVGLSLDTSSLVAGFIQLAFWVGTIPPIYTVERYGRRPTLLIGSVALSICMILFTVGIAVPTQGASNLALAALVMYEIVFGMSWNCLPWIVPAEITPLHLRHVGGAIGPGSEWLWTLVIVLMTPSAIANTGWKIYILFIIMSVLGFPFTYFFLPETKGKTLEEIDYLFASGDAKIQLEQRFEMAAARAHAFDSIKGDKLHELEEVEP